MKHRSITWLTALTWAATGCRPDAPAEDSLPLLDSEARVEALAPCDPPLTLAPDEAWIPAGGLATLSPSGGTGDYRLTIEEPGAGGTISEGPPVWRAPDLAGGTDLLLLEDRGCVGEARAAMHAVAALTVTPAGARVAPGTTLTPEIAGGSGEWTCALSPDASGATLTPGCAYTAGPGEGVDLLVVEDLRSGQRASARLEVAEGAALRAWGQGGVFAPVGSTFTLHLVDGSGEVEVLSLDGPFSAEGHALTAEAEGAGRITLRDRFTGETLTLPLRGLAPLQAALPRDGERSGEGVVLPLGDLDGDGYDDVALGFIEISVGAWYEGGVGVWRGGPAGLSASPDLLLTGGERLRTLGRALALAEVDGDGLPDLIVGADRDDRGETNNGAVLVHRGQADGRFEETPWRSLYGEAAYDRFGSALAACDFDGDGWLDLAVGAREAVDATVASPATDQGAVHVFWGGARGWSDQADFILYGVLPDGRGGHASEAGMQLGAALVAGDIDGDGLCDLVTGAPGDGADGAVQVYRGDAVDVLERAPSLTLTGAAGQGGEAGRRLALGDVDGDGLLDIAFSEWGADAGGEDAGAVHVALGGQVDFTFVNWTYHGASRLENLGSDLQLVDFDGDGLDDLLVGAWRSEQSATNQGGVLVFMDLAADIGAGEAGAPGWTIWGEERQGRLGQAAAAVGDVDGDGVMDLVALAGASNHHGVEAGALWWLTAEGEGTRLELPGAASGHQLGAALATLDVDGDGHLDLLVGAPEAGDEEVGANAGALMAWLGPDHREAVAIRPEGFDTWTASDRLGVALATLDFDGDGHQDLALGVRSDSRPSSYASTWSDPEGCGGYAASSGAVLILPGGPSGLSRAPRFIWHVPEASGRVEALARAGDVDGDGDEELLAGSTAWGEGGGFALISGRAAATPTVICDPDTREGLAAYDFLGSSLAPLGDLDGDGCDDFAVGARGEQVSSDWYDQGVVRVFWGAGGAGCPAGLEASTLTFRMPRAALGSSLASGEDLDGDGLDDLLIGGITHRVDFAERGGAWLSPGAWLLEQDRAPAAEGALPDPAEWGFLLPDTGAEGQALGLIGEQGGARFGAAVALLPDPERPGHALAAVGLPAGDLGAGARTGGVQLHRALDGGLDPLPWMIVVGDSRSPDAELGAVLLALPGEEPALLVGAPTLDGQGVDLGGALRVPLTAP